MVGSLIRWGALGTVVLLVRAIVREAHENRSPVILLPPSTEKRPGTGPRRRRPAPSQDVEAHDEPAGESEAPTA
ncbi:MAG: hypothetical protein QM699_10555 [Amaricoccus sp.]|uniref:hypothetical protein n=1 Tax=Amaricoccus sp. TaxID=1872485 RepID=UPI0039E6A7E5